MKKIYKLFVLIFLVFGPILYANPLVSNLTSLVEYLEEKAYQHRKDPSQSIPIVAIGGCPGVGKTFFTKRIFQYLQTRGIRCAIVPIDDFNLSSEQRKKFVADWSISHFQYTLLHEVLAQILSHQLEIKKPTYDQVTGQVGYEMLALSNCDLVLFEGLYALCSCSPLNFYDYCQCGIYLEADETDITNWKWQREQTKISPRSADQFAKHMKAMLTEFHENIAYSKQNAHFIIKKDTQHHYTLEEAR